MTDQNSDHKAEAMRVYNRLIARVQATVSDKAVLRAWKTNLRSLDDMVTMTPSPSGMGYLPLFIAEEGLYTAMIFTMSKNAPMDDRVAVFGYLQRNNVRDGQWPEPGELK